MRKILRALAISGSVLALMLTAGGLWLYGRLQASLPALDGRLPLAGLSAPVTVARDALGIPTIQGGDRLDVARGSGFVHAQDRFFQMDLLRRSAAGELAALFGAGALPQDRAARPHRFRARAADIVAALPTADRRLLDAYAAGVNAGLGALAAPPFEYLALRTEPSPWRAEDSLLAGYAMYLDLQGMQKDRELTYGIMRDTLPPALYSFLTPAGTEWDAPLQGEALPSPPVPGPEVIDLRARPPLLSRRSLSWDAGCCEPVAGSNNWAMAAGHTAHGGALLANDMHLRLAVPNIWYRAALRYPAPEGGQRYVNGVMLPGLPVIVAGGNGRIAWGFTNSEGDWSDVVILEPAAPPSDAYLTPDGPRPLQHFQEKLEVAQGPAEILDVAWSRWGPVLGVDHRGRRFALRWSAHEREAFNLDFLRLESARSVAEAIAVANRIRAPTQNFVVADADGHIGWTLMGPIPRRFGHSGRWPTSWADGRRGWDGWLAADAYPRIIDPPGGRLWTANARALAGAGLALVGDGGYDLGARARQIRDALQPMERADEKAMLALQLDDRALLLQRWRDLLLSVLTPEALAAAPRRRELRDYVAAWSGRADVASVGYRLTRAFRLEFARQAFEPLLQPCRQAAPDFNYLQVRQFEGPLWRLASEQPLHLLDARYPDWRALALAAVDSVLDQLAEDGAPLAEQTWGRRNAVQIRHPFSALLPWAGRWLDMPAVALPGDKDMPRVQTPTHGASERMVVSPGREADGILHMPAGQSGHPLSPYYRSSQSAWVNGEASPFLPGSAAHVLTLLPAVPAP